MKNQLSFIKTTLIGGLFLIAPIGVLLFIFGKALVLFRLLVAPIADLMPIESVGGIAIARILAFILLLFLCFLAGLVAQTKAAIQLKEWIEDNILTIVPGYTLIKGMTETMAGLEHDKLTEVVLIDIEEVWQIGFLMEKLDEELNVVFLPGAPSPLAGDVVIVKNSRLRKLDITEMEAMKIAKKLGVGSKKALAGKVDINMFK